MNPASIESFLTVVRLGNVTEAARYLYLSQSTVSYRLALLEKELGITLIKRQKGAGNISLTPGGERFLKIAEKWEELNKEAHRIKVEDATESITIGAVDSINVHVLGPLYRYLNTYSSMLKLRVRTHQSTELYSLINHKEVDIAFPQIERFVKNTKVEKFFEEPMVLIKKHDHSPPPFKPISAEDLNPKKELYINWGAPFRIWHEKWWGNPGTSGTQVDTGELIVVYLQEPEYWAVVPVSMANHLSRIHPVSIHPLVETPPKRICYRVQQREPSKAIEIFDECFEMVRDEIEENMNLDLHL